MNKKSKLLAVSMVLGILYVVYLVSYFVGTLGSTTGVEQAGTAIAAALILPHFIATIIAVIFNILGWSMNKRGFALTGAILYTVALVLFPIYFMFVIIQMILSYVAFSQMKKEVILAPIS